MSRRDRLGLPDTATGMAEGIGALITGIYWLIGIVAVLVLVVIGLIVALVMT